MPNGPFSILLMALPVAVAIIVVGLRTGGLRALLGLRIRHRWLVAAAAAVQFLRLADPDWAAAVLRPLRGAVPVVVIWLLVTVFAVANLPQLHRQARAAMAVFLAGMTMNSAAIVANGGMPYSVPAARRAGFGEAAIGDALGHRRLTAESHLAPLADVIPVPYLQTVASVGDLLIFAGISWLLISIALRATRRLATPAPVPA